MTTKVSRDVFDGVTRPILDIRITGGQIDGTTIGQTTPAAGKFTNFAVALGGSTSVAADMLPATDNLYYLGSNSLRWKGIYLADGVTINITAGLGIYVTGTNIRMTLGMGTAPFLNQQP